MTNIITVTRAALGLSQAEFGRWLAEQMGRDQPFSRQHVHGWESGQRSPRRNVRQACAKVAAEYLAGRTAEEIEAVLTS